MIEEKGAQRGAAERKDPSILLFVGIARKGGDDTRRKGAKTGTETVSKLLAWLLIPLLQRGTT